MQVQVVRWAILSRVCLLTLQLLVNNLIPDHEGSMNDVFMKDMRTPAHSAIVEVFFGGLDNWDAEYFIYVSEHGYEYEQTMAFFPLLPSMMWLMSRTLLLPLTLFMPGRSVALVSGVVINFVAFVAAAVALYELTMEVFHSKRLSLISVALLCVNPASVFMSAVYTEAIFMCFSFWGMLSIQRGRPATACALFALATASRANGTVLCGYIGFYYLRELYQLLRRYSKLAEAPHVCLLKFFRLLLFAVLQCCTVLLPFVLFQCFGYARYCGNNAHATSSTRLPPWCQWSLPLPYFYIQQHYWDVGFMRYYHWKQIPNFLLAAPMSLLCLYSLFQAAVLMLSNKPTKPFNLLLLPFFLHLLFLVLFGIFNMHVQVLTRFVASSSPLTYWFAAKAVLNTLPPNFDVPDSFSRLSAAIFQLDPRESQLVTNSVAPAQFKMTVGQLIVCYFCAYYFIGCVVHCNFFPWT